MSTLFLPSDRPPGSLSLTQIQRHSRQHPPLQQLPPLSQVIHPFDLWWTPHHIACAPVVQHVNFWPPSPSLPSTHFHVETQLSTMPSAYGDVAFRVTPQAPNAHMQRDIDKAPKRRGSSQELPKSKRAKTRPTRLRKGKDVKASVPIDVWNIIFQYSEPKVLFQMRKVSRGFAKLLAYEGVWKECRLHYYGPGLPPPPAGLKEAQYLNLLEGHGCMACDNKATRKTYWAYMSRWCEKCFLAKTLKHSEATAIASKHPGLLECIMHATIDSWGSYEYAGSGTDRLKKMAGHGDQAIYLRSDVVQILGQYEAFLASTDAAQWPDEKKEEESHKWLEEQKAEVQARLTEIFKVEEWLRMHQVEKQDQNKRNKKQRQGFYRRKASQLNPPIEEAALSLIPAYQNAIKIYKPATEKSWNILQPKLVQDADDARTLLQSDADIAAHISLCKAVVASRRDNGTEEQKLVLKLADQAIAEVKQRPDARLLSDEDFSLLVLENVWIAYNRLPYSERPESPLPTLIHPTGRWALTLDDARMIYEYPVVRALMDRKRDSKARLQTSIFKCPGCVRPGIQKRFTLKELWIHIREKHAQTLGSFTDFRKAGSQRYTYFWFNVTWPRNLPALAEHQQATGDWDPNDFTPFQPGHAMPEISQVTTGRSPFDGRQASDIYPGRAKGRDDFVGNVIDIATAFKFTDLPADIRSKLALRYALERYEAHVHHQQSLADDDEASDQAEPPIAPDFSVFEELSVVLIGMNDFELFEGMCCKACADAEPERLGRHYGNTPHTRGNLIHHYKSNTVNLKNHGRQSWSTNMFKLPSDEALANALWSEGMEAARAMFDSFFPRKGIRMPAPVARSSMQSAAWAFPQPLLPAP